MNQIHPSAIIGENVRMGDGNQIFSHCFIGHDVQIHNRVFMTAGCRIAGTVTIQDQVNLGMGSLVRERLTLGKGAQIGMGAVVVRDVLPYETVVGNPARSLGLNIRNISTYVSRKRFGLPYRLLMKLWNFIYKL